MIPPIADERMGKPIKRNPLPPVSSPPTIITQSHFVLKENIHRHIRISTHFLLLNKKNSSFFQFECILLAFIRTLSGTS
jgi:hypothetical protein